MLILWVKLVGKIRTRFQTFSGNSDSANWPGYEADRDQVYEPRETEHPTQTLVFTKNLWTPQPGWVHCYQDLPIYSVRLVNRE